MHKAWAVLITRPAHQAPPLVAAIEALGGTPFVFPTLCIEPLPLNPHAITQLALAKVIIVTSANAAYCLPPNAISMIEQSAASILSIGAATTEALTQQGLAVAHTELAGASSESLLTHPWLQHITDQPITLLSGQGGRGILAAELLQRGALVNTLATYQRLCPSSMLPPSLMAQWLSHTMAITLVTSEQGLSNLLELTHLPQQHNLKQNPLLVISPRLWRYAQKLGFQHIWQATSPQLTDIEYALRKLLNLG